MNSSSKSEDFNYLENRVTISWCGLPLNDILSLAGRIFWRKLWTAIWKLHDFMNNFYERFIPIHLYLHICYLFDECPCMRYLKDSGGFVYTQNMYHELSWFNCMDKFTKQMWRNQETNLRHPPFWLYWQKLIKQFIPFFDEAWFERCGFFSSVICSMKKIKLNKE